MADFFVRAWWKLLLLLFIAMPSVALAQDLLERLRQLTDQGQFIAAYQLAVAELDSNLGDAEFDFYYALAALGTNRAGEAMLALERVMMLQPWNERARLELGRAHLNLGEYDQAKRAFEQVLAADPPQNVRVRVQMLIDLIDKRLAEGRWRRQAWFTASAGYDSNINAAADVNSVTVPGLGGAIALDPNSQEIEDGFTEVLAAGELKYQLNQQAAGFAAMTARDRNNFDSDTFDSSVLGAQLGWERHQNESSWRVPLNVEALWLDGTRYRESASASLEWKQHRSGALAPNVYAQAGAFAYPTQPERDAQFWIVGGGASTQRNGRTVSIGIYYADEDADDDRGAHNGRRYGGASIAAQWAVSSRVSVSAQIGAQESEYHQPDPVFAAVRREHMYHGGFGLAWRSAGRLTWKLDGSFIANDSNLELYEYSRSVISGSVVYAF